MNDYIEKLNAAQTQERISALEELKTRLASGEIDVPERQVYTNNHVHTKYSFSPYSPAKAVWMAYMSGLSTVGIIDHDAINGAEEFIRAGEVIGIPTTIGFELRTDWSDTTLAGKRINNPDQLSSAYICAHGLPHTQIKQADAYLGRIRASRDKRNRAMMQKLRDILQPHGLSLDYDSDVLPISYAQHGGEVTERHLLFALAEKMMQKFGAGQKLIDFLQGPMEISLSGSQKAQLEAKESDLYIYDLLNVLKGGFVPRIYIDTDTEETPPVAEVVAFIKELGAIPTYCYLGDVGASPTGDKKAQKFEDDYLEDVFEEVKRIGFTAVAFMPSRNTKPQLERVMALCDRYGFLQISGEDINQPRQSFICKQLEEPEYRHLIDTTWAVVGHEKSATQSLDQGMFAQEALNMDELIEKYKNIGLNGGERL